MGVGGWLLASWFDVHPHVIWSVPLQCLVVPCVASAQCSAVRLPPSRGALCEDALVWTVCKSLSLSCLCVQEAAAHVCVILDKTSRPAPPR